MLIALTIPFRPHRLAECANQTGNVAAALIGALGVGIIFALPVGGLGALINEPYGDSESFLTAAAEAAVGVGWACFVVAALTAIAILFGYPGRPGLDTRVLVLSPMTIALPAAAWSVMFVIALIPEAYHTRSAAPAWTRAGAVQIFGSCLWFFAFTGAWVCFLVIGLRKAAAFGVPHVCEECEYDLAGLPAEIAKCPECGAGLPALPVDAAAPVSEQGGTGDLRS